MSMSALDSSMKSSATRIEFARVTTAKLGLEMEPGRTLDVSVQGFFRSASVSFAVLPADASALSTAPKEIVTNNVGTHVSLPFSFVNFVFTKLYGSTPINLGQSGQNAIQVQDVSVATLGNGMRVTGTVSGTPAGSLFRIAADWAGTDLVFEKVSLVEKACGNMSPVDCAGRELALNLATGVASARFSGRPLRPVSTRHIKLAGARAAVPLLLRVNKCEFSAASALVCDIDLWLGNK
jgi:hypothetical protein